VFLQLLIGVALPTLVSLYSWTRPQQQQQQQQELWQTVSERPAAEQASLSHRVCKCVARLAGSTDWGLHCALDQPQSLARRAAVLWAAAAGIWWSCRAAAGLV
jgi:hypothetical protein